MHGQQNLRCFAPAMFALLYRPRIVDWPPVPVRLPALAECLVLAVLLHLLAVALFGSAPGGTARPGEGVWGAINVRLAGSGEARGDVPLPPPETAGPRGAAEAQRWGGQVREPDAPPPQEQPGAARLGSWQPARTPGAAEALPPPLAQPATPVPELPPVPAPAPLPEPVAQPEPEPALRELRDGSSALRELTPLPHSAAPLPAVTTPGPLPEFVPLQRPPEPVAAPVTSSLPAPPPLAPPAAAPLPRVAPADTVALPAAPPPLQQIPLAPSPRGVPTARPAEAAGPAPTPDSAPARPVLGAPDAGAVVGHDVATPPAAAASQPRLNLDYVRPRGGEISPLGSRGVVNLLPVPPEVKSKLAEDILKTVRPDCRTAYANQGLVGALPLAADALRKDGCRW